MRRARAMLLLGLLAGGCAGEQAEGRPWVHSLTLEGVHNVDADAIKGRIAVQQTSWLPLSPRRYLDPYAVETDRGRIEAFYRAHGYFDARVVDSQVKPRRNKEAVDVTFTVEEGAPTRLRSVTVTGLDGLGKAGRAASRLHLKPGQVFNHDRYLQQKDAILGTLKMNGYAWAEVEGQVEIDRDARHADVRLSVAPGPRAQFGTVEVRGTREADPKRLAIRAGIDAGTRFDLELLERARGRIYNLGMFSSVKVDYTHDETRPEVANVVITVRESQMHELRLGVGFGLESQRSDVHLEGIYTKHNFRGGLRTLNVSLNAGYVALPAFWRATEPGARQGPAILAVATLTQPDLFWRTQLKFSLGYEVGIDYAYQYHGPRIGLGLDRTLWRERVHLALSYNFELLLFFNTNPVILLNPTLAGPLFGFTNPYRLGWFQQEATLDLRDRPLDATRGGWFGFAAEEGGIYAGGAFTYEKLTPEVRGYLPLGGRVVLAGRVEFGQLFQHGTLGSPITRRYYLGGPSSHRGFNYDRLSLQVPSLGANGQPQPGALAIPIGGDQMFLAQLELRVKLFQIAGNWLSGAAFLDAGDVGAPDCGASCQLPSGSSPNVDFFNLYYATGGGLRYKTVIGTLRVDLGVRLNRLSPFESNGVPNADPGERVVFHISVGEAF
jgi:translocation and assembly module TamA